MDPERNINDQTDFLSINNNQADQERDYGTTTRAPLARKQILLIILLCLSMLVTSMSYSIIAVFYPLAAYKKGVTASEVGYVFAIFYMGTFIFSPAAGALITRIGTRRILNVSMSILSIVTTVFVLTDYYKSKVPFLATCLVLRFIQGLGVVGIQTSTLTIVAHQFKSRVGTVTGFLEMSNGIGFSFSAGLGGILYQFGGYGAPFYCMFAFSALITILCWKYIPESEERMDSQISMLKSISLLKHPSMYICTIMTLVLMCDVGFISTYTSSFYKQKFQLADYKIGLLLLSTNVIYSLVTSPVGLFIDKTGLVHLTIVFGLLFRGIAHTVIEPTVLFHIKPILGMSIGGQLMFGVFTVMALIPIYKYYQLQARKSGYDIHAFNTSTMISTLVTATQALGFIIGPILSGRLIEDFGFGWTHIIFGMLILLSAVLVLMDYLSTMDKCCKRISNKLERAPLVINSEANHDYID